MTELKKILLIQINTNPSADELKDISRVLEATTLQVKAIPEIGEIFTDVATDQKYRCLRVADESYSRLYKVDGHDVVVYANFVRQ